MMPEEMTILGIAIVKDEIEHIDALLRAPVDDWLIVDTGSTDGTYEALLERGISVGRVPWVNFGHNRSELLALARGRADWLLATDADMTWEIDPDFVPDPAVEAYMIRMGSDDFAYRLPLLLRGDLPWMSRGVVHEYTTLPDRPYISTPTDKVRVTHHDAGRSSPEKTARYAAMLEAEWEHDSSDPRTAFYLAQQWREMGDPRAVEMYQRRIEMGGWDQETYYAMYRRALLLPWPEQADALMAAWEFRPSRLEALHALVRELNRRGLHHAAYRLSSVAVLPTDDALFVHRDVWDWGMEFERSIAMWWAGDREMARRVMGDLLSQNLPPNIREAVERNRTF